MKRNHSLNKSNDSQDEIIYDNLSIDKKREKKQGKKLIFYILKYFSIY